LNNERFFSTCCRKTLISQPPDWIQKLHWYIHFFARAKAVCIQNFSLLTLKLRNWWGGERWMNQKLRVGPIQLGLSTKTTLIAQLPEHISKIPLVYFLQVLKLSLRFTLLKTHLVVFDIFFCGFTWEGVEPELLG